MLDPGSIWLIVLVSALLGAVFAHTLRLRAERRLQVTMRMIGTDPESGLFNGHVARLEIVREHSLVQREGSFMRIIAVRDEILEPGIAGQLLQSVCANTLSRAFRFGHCAYCVIPAHHDQGHTEEVCQGIRDLFSVSSSGPLHVCAIEAHDVESILDYMSRLSDQVPEPCGSPEMTVVE